MKLDPVTETLLKNINEEDDLGDDPNPLNHPVVQTLRKAAKKVLTATAEKPIRLGGTVK
jgi:hypothetical protein